MDLGPVAEPLQAGRTPDTEAEHVPRVRVGKGLSTRTQVVLLLIGAGILAVLFLVIPAVLRLAASAAAPAAAAPASGFMPTPAQWANLKIETVASESFRSVEETDGKIALDDDRTTPVFSPFSGRVARLFVKAGDTVQAGAPLLAVDASEFVQGQNDLVTAVAALTTARAQLRLAQTSEKRQHDLFLANAGALKDWQQSQVDLANAQGGLNSAQIALGAVRNRLRILGKSDKEIAALENSVNPGSFNPSSVVVAPISGTVTQRQVGLGQYIVSQSSGGSTSVFSIGDLSHVWLVANVREADSPRVKIGDPVEVHLPAFPGRVFTATIVFVAPSIDPNTHRLLVHAEIDNADGALKPEMLASFSIVTGAAVSAPGVPDSAVVYEGETARVFVADSAAKSIAIREIRTGRTNGRMIEVLEGLKPGEQVVTSGALFIDRALQPD